MATSKDNSWVKIREGLSPAQMVDVLRTLFRRIFERLDDLDLRGTGTTVPDDSITAAKIAAGAVGSSEIAAGAVGSDEIATNAVGSDEIAPGAVGASELATVIDQALHSAPDFTLGAEAADVRRITVQLKSIGGSNLTNEQTVLMWLSDTSKGAPATVAPFAVTVITGITIAELAAREVWQIQSGSTGLIVIDVEEAGVKTYYLNVSHSGDVYASAAIDFA